MPSGDGSMMRICVVYADAKPMGMDHQSARNDRRPEPNKNAGNVVTVVNEPRVSRRMPCMQKVTSRKREMKSVKQPVVVVERRIRHYRHRNKE